MFLRSMILAKLFEIARATYIHFGDIHETKGNITIWLQSPDNVYQLIHISAGDRVYKVFNDRLNYSNVILCNLSICWS